MRCLGCGGETLPAHFCDLCGRALATAQPSAPLLHVARIGRSESMDIIVASDGFQVGRHHADLLAAPDGTLYLVDNRSTNGTAVDGVQLTPGVPHRVALNSQIFFGSFLFNTALLHDLGRDGEAPAPAAPVPKASSPRPEPSPPRPVRRERSVAPAIEAVPSIPPPVVPLPLSLPLVEPAVQPPAAPRRSLPWVIAGTLTVAAVAFYFFL